jgi:hypothetical protein
MDQTLVYGMLVALVVVVVAIVLIIVRQRGEAPPEPGESTYATSTEGMKRCPNCGMGNLVTDVTCSSCGKRLPG